jgi:hypothetical protein
MGEPFEAGAVQETLTRPVPDVTDTAVGALGTVAGTIAFDATDGPDAVAALAPYTVEFETTLKV